MADALIVTRYQQLLRQLLPRGLAFEGALLGALRDSCAVEYARVEERLFELLREADPAQSLELLADWERVTGLPDSCVPADDLTLTQRRNRVIERLASRGGQSRQYFLDMAANIGVTDAKIIEYRPFRAGSRAGDRINGIQKFRAGSRAGTRLRSPDWAFTWDLNSPLTEIKIFRAGSRAGDRLREFGNDILSCLVQKNGPAHANARVTFTE